MYKYLFLALILLSGCGLFKNRNVQIDKRQETSSTKIDSRVIDSSFSLSNRLVALHHLDSSGTWTKIQGNGITVKPDGTIHIAKGSVDQHANKKTDTKLSDNLQTTAGQITDQSVRVERKAEVKEKVKQVESKPSMLVLYIAIVIVLAGVGLYVVKRK